MILGNPASFYDGSQLLSSLATVHDIAPAGMIEQAS
jgi:hypothetical protein